MKNKRIIPFLLALAIALPSLTKAQEKHTFNLQECIDYAYEHQDSIRNAKLDIERADYQVKEILGSGFPQISGNANLQDYLKVPTSLIPGELAGQPGQLIPVQFTQKYSSSLGINVDQLLFDGTFLVGVQASKTFRELSQRNLDRTRIAANIAVTKAYYQVLVSSEQITLLDANVKQLKQQLDETVEMNKQGFVEKIDADRLKVLYNNLQTTRSTTLRMLALSYQLLKFQMGMPVGDQLVLKDKIDDISFEPAALAASDSTAYRNRIEYELLQTNRKLNELDVKRYKSMLLPSLSAFGSSSYSFIENSFGKLYDQKYPSTLVGVRLKVPVFTGFQTKSRISQARIDLQKTDNVINGFKKAINLQIEQARTLYANGVETLGSQRENMDLAREVLRVSRIKYEQGVGSSIEVTQAQTALQEAENTYIQALYNALVSKVDLEAANGTIK
jgi:outer membrane protein TolC